MAPSSTQLNIKFAELITNVKGKNDQSEASLETTEIKETTEIDEIKKRETQLYSSQSDDPVSKMNAKTNRAKRKTNAGTLKSPDED
ncbi:hypothetical protein DSO57_1008692 [Entomophthora muscae]|uniref:Uncharacterized protein n=1 Tax=Entomophthora muscae TaxID=34485 RepID=A0ACC2U4T0_9FUNG|nr:hypothetical protein DSO57_1008692 [Entomophthora muscae]